MEKTMIIANHKMNWMLKQSYTNFKDTALNIKELFTCLMKSWKEHINKNQKNQSKTENIRF